MHKLSIILPLSLPLAAQSLSLSCPNPSSFNQSAVCQIVVTTPAATSIVGAQWTLTSTPKVTLTVTTPIASKSIGVGPTGVYVLSGVNKTAISGVIANVTVPAHSGSVTLALSGAVGTSATAHAVPITPGVSVTVQ